MSKVDVVVVSYNSRDRLRACVEPLAGQDDITPIVVDNASPDRSLEALEGLAVRTIARSSNGGFAVGCNVGWRAGSAPAVLFLNPDARIAPSAVRRLVRELDGDQGAGVVGPRILHEDGSLDYSQRRFPRLRSLYANALFLHRLAPRAAWCDDMLRDDRDYLRTGSPDWVSGACLLVRRRLLVALGGFDEGFFLYSEDTDLCRRARDAGFEVRFVPEAVSEHEGGGSTPRNDLLAVHVSSRLRYARKHRGRAAGAMERAGLALWALTHATLARGDGRSGYVRALAAACRRDGHSRRHRAAAGALSARGR